MRSISQDDLGRWRNESLRVANMPYSDYHILDFLRKVPITLIPKYGGQMLYGRAYSEPAKVEVYQTNPSKTFSARNWELYNQSGMDHELIGHLYQMLGLMPDCRESTALRVQEEMAIHRAITNPEWIEIAELIGFIPLFKTIRGQHA